MTNPTTAPPRAWSPGPDPRGLGRLPVWVSAALALGLHVLLLAPARPTLIGSVANEPPAVMLVRMLEIDARDRQGGVARLEPPISGTAPGQRLPEQPPEPPPAAWTKTSAMAPQRADSFVSASPAAPDPLPTPPPVAGLPAAPDYFAGGRLDPGPRPLEDVEPAYPEEAKQQEGSVVLRLLINETGTVDNVAVVRAYPAGLFDRSALEAFGKARFSPGRVLGLAVKSQITIEVMFSPTNRGKVSGRSY